MIPASFEYHSPDNLRLALKTIRDYDGDARVLAGGMSLIPMMKFRLSNPAAVVDLRNIRSMSGIQVTPTGLHIGAMTTHYAIETELTVYNEAPLLAEAAGRIGDVQVRNRGTIGGATAHADPAADYPAVLLAHEARFTMANDSRRRTVRAEAMFVDSYTTALQENEILIDIRIPPTPSSTGWSYQKLENRASRFAVVGVAALVTRNQSGICERIRIGITGAGPFATRARATERYLHQKVLNPMNITKAAKRAPLGIECLSDVHGSAEYRSHLVAELTNRAIAQASERAM